MSRYVDNVHDLKKGIVIETHPKSTYLKVVEKTGHKDTLNQTNLICFNDEAQRLVDRAVWVLTNAPDPELLVRYWKDKYSPLALDVVITPYSGMVLNNVAIAKLRKQGLL